MSRTLKPVKMTLMNVHTLHNSLKRQRLEGLLLKAALLKRVLLEGSA